MSDKPLHVQVAEALGWTQIHHCQVESAQQRPCWIGVLPADGLEDGGLKPEVPHYDTDWAATGPLIEKYALSVEFENFPVTCPPHSWVAEQRLEHIGYMEVGGPTPLIAVCNLILKLKEK